MTIQQRIKICFHGALSGVCFDCNSVAFVINGSYLEGIFRFSLCVFNTLTHSVYFFSFFCVCL
jgi:hypothetical protein